MINQLKDLVRAKSVSQILGVFKKYDIYQEKGLVSKPEKYRLIENEVVHLHNNDDATGCLECAVDNYNI